MARIYTLFYNFRCTCTVPVRYIIISYTLYNTCNLFIFIIIRQWHDFLEGILFTISICGPSINLQGPQINNIDPIKVVLLSLQYHHAIIIQGQIQIED